MENTGRRIGENKRWMPMSNFHRLQSPHKFFISQELVKTAIDLRGKFLLNGKGRQSVARF
jgi:hypothetical protein